MRCVIARVLPVPAPARMQTGPAGAVTAARCSSSRPTRTRPPVDAFSATAGIMAARPDVHRTVSTTPLKRIPPMLTIYSTTWCGYCHRLMSQLDRENIGYTVVDIEQDEAAAEFVMGVNGGEQNVPPGRVA